MSVSYFHGFFFTNYFKTKHKTGFIHCHKQICLWGRQGWPRRKELYLGLLFEGILHGHMLQLSRLVGVWGGTVDSKT